MYLNLHEGTGTYLHAYNSIIQKSNHEMRFPFQQIYDSSILMPKDVFGT